MKNLTKNTIRTLILLMITVAACKKNNPQKEDGKSKFDINNPIGYLYT
ncbi:hypothetical protein ABIE26_001550 [Pedobacter africanus]|uniref:Uncharacterized protein n=1 Tax=Pedobacter africanus TaxID=151894 RepID=A0ACC6KRY1_9SPHI|nr:hypothetical protein [Pedobacter africanus]